MIYADFESMLVPEDKGVLNEKLSKNISLAVMAINYYGLMISLVSLLRHTYTSMKFAIY